MISFSDYLKKSFVRRTTHYFGIILIILNVSLFFVNQYFKQEMIIQKEESFAELVYHLYKDNNVDYAIEYIEHYGHIHNTAIKYFYDGTFVYESEIMGENYKRYDIADTGSYVLIDTSESPNTLLSTSLVVVSNMVFIIIYIMSVYMFYWYAKTKTDTILKDLDKMSNNVAERNFFHNYFTFKEFQDVNDAFYQMYKEIEDSRLIKANKLQSITHDLKTSLTVLRSYIEGAANNRIELGKAQLDLLIDEIKANNVMVESLREEYKNQHQEMNLTQELINLCDKFQSVYDTKKMKLHLDLDDVAVTTDRESVIRVIKNILSNAYYYSESNTNVHVTLRETDFIKLVIKDEGIGITDDQLKEVFSKNYRTETSKLMNESGTGLGLYIAKVLIEDLGGQIFIDNRNGTAVIIKLPS